MPIYTCPTELRDEDVFMNITEKTEVGPYCFFQPTSKCGDSATNLWMWGADGLSTEEDKSDYGSYKPDMLAICAKLGSEGGDCTNSRLELWRAIARKIFKLQPEVEAKISSLWVDRHDWAASGSYGALHVRRTDKVKGEEGSNGHHGEPEAMLVPTCEYASRLEKTAAKSTRGPTPQGYHVFVATDDPDVVEELKECDAVKAKGWKLHSFATELSAPGRGMAAEVIYRVWGEIQLLVRAEVGVGTFSSNMGRVVQMLRSQPEGTFVSMDSPNFDIPTTQNMKGWIQGKPGQEGSWGMPYDEDDGTGCTTTGCRLAAIRDALVKSKGKGSSSGEGGAAAKGDGQAKQQQQQTAELQAAEAKSKLLPGMQGAAAAPQEQTGSTHHLIGSSSDTTNGLKEALAGAASSSNAQAASASSGETKSGASAVASAPAAGQAMSSASTDAAASTSGASSQEDHEAAVRRMLERMGGSQ